MGSTFRVLLGRQRREGWGELLSLPMLVYMLRWVRLLCSVRLPHFPECLPVALWRGSGTLAQYIVYIPLPLSWFNTRTVILFVLSLFFAVFSKRWSYGNLFVVRGLNVRSLYANSGRLSMNEHHI